MVLVRDRLPGRRQRRQAEPSDRLLRQTPRKATATRTVTYDAGFSRDADGDSDGLEYTGTSATAAPSTRPTIDGHAHVPDQAGWHNVKLMVSKGDGTKTIGERWNTARQSRSFAPTYYPAVPPAAEPLPPTTGAAADPCGQLSSDELSSMVATSNGPVQGAPAQQAPVGGSVPATLSLTLGYSGRVRRVHAWASAKDYFSLSSTANVISTAGDAPAERRRPVIDGHRSPGQRDVLVAPAVAGSRPQRCQHQHRIQQTSARRLRR